MAQFTKFSLKTYTKEYWTENNMNNFHTIADFMPGNGLIKIDIYND